MPQYPLRCARRLFNPRAREGRDPDSEEAERYIAEFQPARPRGARLALAGSQPFSQLLVSTRAPARGATSGRTDTRSRPKCFNPRAREGRDNIEDAPLAVIPGFNPRAREGRDTGRRVYCRIDSVFQPARPRGARPWLSIRSPRRSSFNPRAREGRDEAIDFWERVVEAFQPARPRGARPPKTSLPKSRSGKFQPARPRGARLGELRRRWRVSRGFNPRAREGRDASRLDRTIPNQGFNPRAREGRDRT